MEMSAVYSSDEHLSKYSYWQKRYQQHSEDLSFEWFVGSEQILDIILGHMDQVYNNSYHRFEKSHLWCLDLGCGTSNLAQSIYTQSAIPVNLVLLDFVHEALQYQMEQISARIAKETSSFCQPVCADVTNLPFYDNTFQVLIDKGTMDALLKDKVAGHPKSQAMISEVIRVLKPGGRVLQISDEDPDTRLHFLEQLSRTHNGFNTDSNLNRNIDADSHKYSQSICHTHNLRELPHGQMKNKTFYSDVSNSESSNINHIITNSDDTNLQRNQTHLVLKYKISPVSFQIIPSNWGSEYFLYWMEKLK